MRSKLGLINVKHTVADSHKNVPKVTLTANTLYIYIVNMYVCRPLPKQTLTDDVASQTQMCFLLTVPAVCSSPPSCPPALLSAATPTSELYSPTD